MTQIPDLIIIGGGAAGMMAAVTAAENGARVTLLERNERCGRKLIITGKGRCNLTNDCDVRELLENVTANSRFLYSAFSRFTPEDTKRFFENLGVRLKTERGRRVFPVSDNAREINDALCLRMKRLGVRQLHARARGVLVKEGNAVGVGTDGGEYPARAVLLATGGLSYPLTGSDGDGFRMAAELGHTIVAPQPSIVPLELKQEFCQRLQGLALKNILLKATDPKGKTVYEEQGELLFTHFGVSGPLILSASAHMRGCESGGWRLLLDLKPALSEEKLDARLLRDFSQSLNRNFENSLGGLFPASLAPVMAELSGISPHTKINSVTREERRAFVSLIKSLPLDVVRPRPIEEAIITAGGVKTSEINPANMESKLISGLYFAGELIDVDAYTGGYNLQIAWSTARAAALAASAKISSAEDL